MAEVAPFFAEVAKGPDGALCHWIKSEDNVRLRVAHWSPKPARGTVLLFPGRTEYIEKYALDAKRLIDGGYAVAVIDWRGQGLADRLTQPASTGHVEHFDDYQKDVRALLAHVETQGLPKPYHLLAHSMGGAIGLAALHENLPVDSAVFSAPMWGIHLSWFQRIIAPVLGTITHVIGLGSRMVPGQDATTYFLRGDPDDNTLTNDPKMWNYIREQVVAHPELGLGGPSFRWLTQAIKHTKRLSTRKPPAVPCLTFLGDQESIVDPQAIKSVMANWDNGTLTQLTNTKHEVLMELPVTRERAFKDALAHFDAHT